METPQPPRSSNFQQLWKGILRTPLPWPSGGPCLDGRRQVGVGGGLPDMRPPQPGPDTHRAEREGGFLRKRRKNIEQSLKIAASWLVIRRQFK